MTSGIAGGTVGRGALLLNKDLQWLRPSDYGPPYSSRPWELDKPFELSGYTLNPDMVVLCEESKVFEL